MLDLFGSIEMAIITLYTKYKKKHHIVFQILLARLILIKLNKSSMLQSSIVSSSEQLDMLILEAHPVFSILPSLP